MLARLLIATSLLAIGCTGEIDADLPPGVSKEAEAARQAWVQKAHPVLDTNCGSCHAGSRPEVAWLEGADVYAQKADLLSYMKVLVNLGAPQQSDLIKKGAHEGPALTAQQASGILDWIQKERDAMPGGMTFPVMLPPAVAMQCVTGAPGTAQCPYNEFALDAAGAAGAKVQFTMMDVAGKVYLSNLKIVPGPGGVYVEHPMFVSVPAMGEVKFDPLDRYAGLMLNLAAGAPAAMQQLGNGTATFDQYPAADPIAVYFKVVGPMK